MLLPYLLQSWSIRKIMREHKVPNYMACQAEWLQEEKGMLESVVPT